MFSLHVASILTLKSEGWMRFWLSEYFKNDFQKLVFVCLTQQKLICVSVCVWVCACVCVRLMTSSPPTSLKVMCLCSLVVSPW